MPTRAGLFVDPYAASTQVSSPTAGSGLASIQSGSEAQSMFGAPAPTSVEEILAQSPYTALGPIGAAQPEAPTPQLRVAVDPEQRKFLVGNTVVDYNDIYTLQRVPELLQEPTGEAPPGNWRPMSLDALKQHKDNLSDISASERVRLGTRDVGEQFVSGIGRLAGMAGAESAEEAIVGFGERLGPSEFDQDRRAVARESNTLWKNMLAAPPEGLPSFATSIAAGMTGGKIGLAIGGPVGAAIGTAVGAFASIFPMMVNSAYETAVAQQGEEYVASEEGKITVLGTALGTTAIQTIVPNWLSRIGLERLGVIATEAGKQVARSATRNALRGGAVIGLAEAGAEASAFIVEQIMFDPTVRASLSGEEVEAVLPYLVRQYGEDAVIAAFGGLVLGGGIGAVASFRRTEAPTVDEDTNFNLVGDTTVTYTGPETPALGPQLILPFDELQGRTIQGRLSRIDYSTPNPVDLLGNQSAILTPEAQMAIDAEIETLKVEMRNELEGVKDPLRRRQIIRKYVQREEQVVQEAQRAEAPPTDLAQGELDLTPLALVPSEPVAAAPEPTAPIVEPVAAAPEPTAPPVSVDDQLISSAQEVEAQVAEEGGQLNSLQVALINAAQELQSRQQEEAAQEARRAQLQAEFDAADQQRREQQFDEAEFARDMAGIPPRGPQQLPLFGPRDMQAPSRGELLRRGISRIEPIDIMEGVQPTTEQQLELDLSGRRRPARKAAPKAKAEPKTEAPKAAALKTKAKPEPKAEPKAEPVKAEPEVAVDADVEGVTTLINRGDVTDIYVFDVAFGPEVSAEAKALARKALDDYLVSPEFDATTFNKAVLNYAQSLDKITKKSAIYKYLDAVGMVDILARTTDVEGASEAADTSPREDGRVTAAVKLANKIRAAKDGAELSTEGGKKLAKELEALWQETIAEGNKDARSSDGLTLLSKFFTEDGKLKQHPSSKRPVTQVITLEQYNAEQKAEAAARRVEEDADGDPLSSLELWNNFGVNFDEGSGNYYTLDGKRITAPLSVGKIRMAVASFLKGLKIKPKVSLYKNQADLKRRNPTLYKKAAAGRAQKDFDTANAAGYSFGDGEVIIFTSRIANEQTLRFVLAHETLGHFGFRGLVPEAELNKILDRIYESNETIRQAVDEQVAVTNQSRREATEEYLADVAAVLDTSTLNRLWTAIKNFLEKIPGVQFEDHLARYFVSQARRYVRNGKAAAFPIEFSAIANKIVEVESAVDVHNIGRFYTIKDLYHAGQNAGLMNDTLGISSIDDAVKQIKKVWSKTTEFGSKAREQLFSLRTFRFEENPGASLGLKYIQQAKNHSMSIVVSANEKMRVLLQRGVLGKDFGGISKEEYQQVSDLIYSAMFAKIAAFKASDLGKAPLVRLSRDGKVVPNKKELDRLFEKGLVSFEEARDGFKWVDIIEPATADAEAVTETNTFEGIKGLDKRGKVWAGYLASREVVRDVWESLLVAKYEAYAQNRDMAFREIGEYLPDGTMSQTQRDLLLDIQEKYIEIFEENIALDDTGAVAYDQDSIDNANAFVEAVNRAILRDADQLELVVAKFPGREDQVRKLMVDFSNDLKFPTEDSRFVVQNKIKEILLEFESATQADKLARQSLVEGYAPLRRRGDFQIRMIAKLANGTIVPLKGEHKDMLAFRQFETVEEAESMAHMMNTELFQTPDGKPKFFEGIMAYDSNSGEYKPTAVSIEVISEAALSEASAPPQLNLNEFIRGLRQFSIALPPKKMRDVVLAMTNQNNSARKRLLRRQTPGFDSDAPRAISEFVESMASTIGKTIMRPKMAELMNMNLRSSQLLWNGDPAKLAELERRWKAAQKDASLNEAQKFAIRREYFSYKAMYDKTNPPPRADGRAQASRANQYRNEFISLLTFLESNKRLAESDFEAGAVVSNLRAFTSMFQLGASAATGTLNYVGAWLNGVPTLATFNENTGFGGGFGFGRSVMEFQKALGQIGMIQAWGNSKLNTAEFYDSMATNQALLDKYGLKKHEAEFIAREIREGVMIPAQSNALLGTARGRIASGLGQKVIDGWMFTFNTTEQGSRRGLGLAAYRLEYERAKANGKSDADAAEIARDFAVKLLNTTVGEYSVTNRPPFWRSGLPSLMYMYKVFPTTSIQMFARLDKKGKVAFLFGLWLLAGMRGFPFAEDLEDLFDTIAMGLGFRTQGIQIEFAKMVDSIAPGLSPVLMRGVLNQFGGPDVAARTSLSNIVPGTNMFLPGPNASRAFEEIGGPIVGMLSALSDTVPAAMRAVTTDRVSIEDVARQSPITMLRALGDAWAYTQTGAIVDRRGYVLANDAHAGIILGRLLGWYPAEASKQYDIIRTSQRFINYQRETAASFRIAWIKAMIRGDVAKAKSIERSVDLWNEGAKGTALEIRNFRQNAMRAYREAKRPGVERFMRSTPLAARQDVDMVADLLGL